MKSLSICASMIFIAFSFVAKAGFVPTPPISIANPPPPGQSGTQPLPTMNYWGGPVVEHVKVYAIYWGQGVNSEIQMRMGGFLTALTNSTYFDQLNGNYNTDFTSLNGYPGTQQQIGRGTFAGAFTITPSDPNPVIDDTKGHREVSAEIAHQIAIGVLPPNDANTDYVVFLPPNINARPGFGEACKDWCAYHGAVKQNASYINYAVIPDLTKQGQPKCNECASYSKTNDVFDATTYLVSSQIACGVTDPEVDPDGTPNGGAPPESWIANDGETEIATMCIYNDTSNSQAPESSLKVQSSASTIYEVAPFWTRTVSRTAPCSQSVFVSP